MADSNLNVIRTNEDLVNVISVLYFNLNEIERIYYDMFINTTPMDITFQRYDDLGVLETITLPNRAKDRQTIITGNGNPNGIAEANPGAMYLDLTSYDLYYKSSGSDSQGWILLYSNQNLNYLAPDGDGSQLTNLNMSNAGSGTLAVERGGTGVANISGLIKGNGTNAFSSAVDGNDYMGPNSMTGVIMFYPVATIPPGWLICDGKPYKKASYSRLFNVIGDTYGVPTAAEITAAYPSETNPTISDWFKVPYLTNYFIRCWDGVRSFNGVQSANPGAHKHRIASYTENEGSHTHDRGNMNITGQFANEVGATPRFSGAFYKKGAVLNDSAAPGGESDALIGFDASRSWTGHTSAGTPHRHYINTETQDNSGDSETRVLNKMLVPIIKW